MKISEAFDQFLYDVQGRYEGHTIRTYNNGLIRFAEYLETDHQIKLTHALSNVTGRIMRRFPGWLSNKYAVNTTLVYSKAVGRWFKWLLDEEISALDESDMRKYRNEISEISRSRHKRLPKPMGPDILEALKKAIELDDPPIRQRNMALIAFLLETGCRVSEIIALTIEDIDQNRHIRVIGKGDKERIVMITDTTLELLKDYWRARKYQAPDDPVFATHARYADPKKHNPLTTNGIRYIFNRLAKYAGLDPDDIHPHRFRHTFATNMLAATGDLAAVQDMLGHATPETTRIYAEVTTDQKEQAFKKAFPSKDQATT